MTTLFEAGQLGLNTLRKEILEEIPRIEEQGNTVLHQKDKTASAFLFDHAINMLFTNQLHIATLMLALIRFREDRCPTEVVERWALPCDAGQFAALQRELMELRAWEGQQRARDDRRPTEFSRQQLCAEIRQKLDRGIGIPTNWIRDLLVCAEIQM